GKGAEPFIYEYTNIDHRGYVEPEPEVYARLVSLANATADGLEYYNALNETDKTTLTELADVCNKLTIISEKELRDELLTRYEYEFIRDLFGQGLGEAETDYDGEWRGMNGHTEYADFINKIWCIAYNHYKSESIGNDNSDRFSSPLVTTIAQNSNTSLVEAIGYVDRILVIVPVEGVLRVCQGLTYSYYEFAQPTNQRATDRSWKEQIGICLDYYGDNEAANFLGYYEDNNGVGKLPERPYWINYYSTETLSLPPNYYSVYLDY
ncbi:MAG: DUF3160 domain-containing protein, partial [Erysipelotrichaceae bacterium]|nr:DUF3160 domain-containing protein [Erysipelotrichaceae bacterium]